MGTLDAADFLSRLSKLGFASIALMVYLVTMAAYDSFVVGLLLMIPVVMCD